MNTLYFKFILCSLLIFTLVSCDTPKSLTKKGDKFAEKNLYQDASIWYMKALNKKVDFIAAKEGLRFSGQKQVNAFLDDFFKSKNFGDKRAAIYQLRNINSEEVDELILNLIHKETDHTIREEILNLLHARESTETSYELAISFYEAEESESLKSDALIAITNLGSCCIRDLQDRLIFISKNDSSDIIKSIAESYYNRITQ